MFKLLIPSLFALLCACGTATHQQPSRSSLTATINNQIIGSLSDGRYHRVIAIDGKEVHSLNNRWPIRLLPGHHEVILQAKYIGFSVPGSPISGTVASNFNLQAGVEYNLIGKRVSDMSEMWLEEKNSGKRVTPVSRAQLRTIPAGAPTIIFL